MKVANNKPGVSPKNVQIMPPTCNTVKELFVEQGNEADANDEAVEKQSNTDILSTQAEAPTEYEQDLEDMNDAFYVNEEAQPGDYHLLNDQIPEEIEKELSTIMRMVNNEQLEIAEIKAQTKEMAKTTDFKREIDELREELSGLQKLVLLEHSELVQRASGSTAFISETDPGKSIEQSIPLTSDMGQNDAFISQTNVTTELETSIETKRIKFHDQNNETQETPHVLDESNDPEAADNESDTDEKQEMLYSSSIEYGKPFTLDHKIIPQKIKTTNLSSIFNSKEVIAPQNMEQSTLNEIFVKSYVLDGEREKISVVVDNSNYEIPIEKENFEFDPENLEIRMGNGANSVTMECQSELEYKLKSEQIIKHFEQNFKAQELKILDATKQIVVDGEHFNLSEIKIDLLLMEEGIYKLEFLESSEPVFFAVMTEQDASAFIERACDIGATLL